MTQGVRLYFSDKDYAELTSLLESVENSCAEAISGEWDYRGPDALEGFEAMEQAMSFIRHYLEAARLRADF